MTQPTYHYVDHAKLLADLRAEDGAAVAWAYRQVFGSETGRLVLTHQLALAGVGTAREPSMTALERADHDGAARHALNILNLAGFDRMSAAHAIAADVLEGQNHDRHDADRSDDGSTDRRFSGPDVLSPG